MKRERKKKQEKKERVKRAEAQNSKQDRKKGIDRSTAPNNDSVFSELFRLATPGSRAAERISGQFANLKGI